MKIIDVIFNIIFGLSFGLVISSYFLKNNLYHGPNSKEIQIKTFKDNNKCYKLIPKVIKCSFYDYHI